MIILQVNNVSKYYGAEAILSTIKLEVQTKDRIALVGRNGAGKSTLLKIIAGHLSHDSGEIYKPKDVSIGYLAQNTGLQSDRSIWDEMISVFEGLQKQEDELRLLEKSMADPSVYNDEQKYNRVLKDYDRLQEQFKNSGGYQMEADVRSVLHGLRFSDYDYTTSINSLSGGQKTRLALGKLLLTKPDLLILDEPTNHLDIDTLSWLEGYLQSYPGAILIVSHDRYFLDKVVHQVMELSRTSIKKYTGNYSRYLEQKAEEYERNAKLYEKQQDEIAKLKDFVQRNMARASTTKRAQSRQKALQRMEVMDRPLGDEKSANFTFEIEKQSGNEVLQANDLSIGYEAPVASHLNFRITRGESIALIGPNGVGKSTLLKTLINRIPALHGDFQLGANVTLGYYDQEQANLSSNKTVLNELWDDFPNQPEKDIRSILGNFLFSGDDVMKTVSTLSGGEKARLALSKLMMQKANLLILDEPTNHLDLDSKLVLENALVDYSGTLLFVSHDRYFINRIADKVLEMKADGTIEYLGDYDYYIQKKQEQAELAELEKPADSISNNRPVSDKTTYQEDKELKKKERQRQRRIAEIETTIEELDTRISDLNTQLCDPEIYQDHEKSLEIQTTLTATEEELEALMEEWTSLQDE
ncbi:ABC-F family ATP-binding cassette domain-containing protein [Pradoshia sp. D12]|uniref:ABC-F family ATP-binding cassette domain-containing protein n=1 Tax=Bacillaceae TaxID=186817 RepID=UPI00080ACEF7|nr:MULTISPECIES: ABC-F family ATP-binding cassette domain-containing protein [Bacillaceae]OCA80777.1 multidrug ABC transporter ATP-binding protein [Bacillus sp. FJAT-27986]QFK70015.1 ABC-F family ATP-binding cassette domain-containing protein [Pradoshia sp. D12]TPF70575.1 ABC-F family ATP-binding cassette domain-containing protein [Bacillus sp. D12]